MKILVEFLTEFRFYLNEEDRRKSGKAEYILFEANQRVWLEVDKEVLVVKREDRKYELKKEAFRTALALNMVITLVVDMEDKKPINPTSPEFPEFMKDLNEIL